MAHVPQSSSTVQELFPQLKTDKYPNLPKELTFLHAEDILDMYPDLPRKQRETETLKKYPAILIYGVGWPLKDACLFAIHLPP